MELLEEATASYQAAVTPAVAQYLHARGIGQAEAVTNRLGVVRNPFPGHGMFENFLSIPYLDKAGRPLTIRFRCLQQHNCRDYGHGKYMTIPGDTPRMYGIASIFEAGDEIHTTEGELDRIILTKLGLPAVGLPGASMWANRHRRMLAGFSRVYHWGDPDDAGAELTAKITRALRSAKPVRLKADVTDTYMAGGADAIFAALGREAVAT
ncbi:toprim domain-containing protein [Kribbella sp. NBC_01505]